MGSKTGFHLVKDFPLTVESGFVQITAEHMSLSDWDVDEINSAGLGAIWGFFQAWSKTKTNQLLKVGGSVFHENVTVIGEFYESLLRAVNEVVGQSGSGPAIYFIIRITPTAEGVPASEYRLNLNGSGSGRYVSFYFTESVPIQNVTCDIRLGWTLPREETASPPTAKRIKMDGGSFIRNVFHNDQAKDLTVVARNGAEIKCHRAIFTAHSSVLAAMVSPTSGMKESQTGRVVMSANSEEGVNLLIRYLYGMEVMPSKIPCDLALELLRTADMYELDQLQDSVGDLFLQKDGAWFGPEGALEFYFHVKNLKDVPKLEEHALSVLSGMDMEEMRRCECFRRLDSGEITDLFCKVVKTLQKSKSGKVTSLKRK